MSAGTSRGKSVGNTALAERRDALRSVPLLASTEVYQQWVESAADGPRPDCLIGLLAQLADGIVTLYDSNRDLRLGSCRHSTGASVIPAELRTLGCDCIPDAQRYWPEEVTGEDLREWPAMGARSLGRRMGWTLRLGQQVTGYLLVEPGSLPSRYLGDAVRFLNFAARTIQLAVAQHGITTQRECLHQLLKGGAPWAMNAAVAQLGVQAGFTYLVACVEYEQGMGKDIGTVASGQTLLPLLRRRIDAADSKAQLFSTQWQGGDILLLCLTDSDAIDVKRIGCELECLVRAARDSLRLRRAVLSSPARTWTDIPQAFAEVRALNAFAKRRAWRKCFLVASDLGIFGKLVVEPRAMELCERFARNQLSAIMDYDDEHGGDLIKTLEAYVDSDGCIRTAASRLEVHENTVRYRLNRIRRIGSWRTGSLHMLIDASLALQVLRLGTDAPRAPVDHSLA